MEEVKKRKCNVCRIIKPKRDFFADKSRFGGIKYICKSCSIIKHKEWRIKNKEKVQTYNKEHREQRAIREQKYREDIGYRLSSNISRRIKYTLKKYGSGKNGRKWEILVSYNSDALKKHLEKTMPIGYTWNNYIDGELHIDHIIPLSAFNIINSDCIDFKRAWDISNLRLLPRLENLRKNAKISKPFQPALGI